MTYTIFCTRCPNLFHTYIPKSKARYIFYHKENVMSKSNLNPLKHKFLLCTTTGLVKYYWHFLHNQRWAVDHYLRNLFFKNTLYNKSLNQTERQSLVQTGHSWQAPVVNSQSADIRRGNIGHGNISDWTTECKIKNG